METQWDQPAEASGKPVCLLSLLCVSQTWLHPTGLAVGLWRASLAVGQCPSASLVGHGAGTWGQGAPCSAGVTTVTNSQVGPCQPEGRSGVPVEGGADVEMGLEREGKLSTQSQKCGPRPSRGSISSSHQLVMSSHPIISSHPSPHHLPFHLE